MLRLVLALDELPLDTLRVELELPLDTLRLELLPLLLLPLVLRDTLELLLPATLRLELELVLLGRS